MGNKYTKDDCLALKEELFPCSINEDGQVVIHLRQEYISALSWLLATEDWDNFVVACASYAQATHSDACFKQIMSILDSNFKDLPLCFKDCEECHEDEDNNHKAGPWLLLGGPPLNYCSIFLKWRLNIGK